LVVCELLAAVIVHCNWLQDYGTEAGYIRQLDHADSLSGTLEQLRAALLHLSDRRSTWTANAAVASSGTAEIQAEIDSSLRKLRAIQTSRAALEAQATTVRATIAGVDAKLPLVNEEKKSAVAERKFKEAGRLTEEVKRLTTQREDAERELSSCLSGIDDSDRNLSDEQSQLELCRKRLSEHEHATDVARIETLREAIRTLRRHIRRVAKPKPLPDRLSDSTSTTPHRPGPQLRLPEGVTPSPAVIPRDADLGVKLEAGGRSYAQVSAKAFLESERDVVLDELNQLCMKHGMDLDLGDDTASDNEPKLAKPIVAVPAAPSVVASPPVAHTSPSSEHPQAGTPERAQATHGEADAGAAVHTEGVLATVIQGESEPLAGNDTSADHEADATQHNEGPSLEVHEALAMPAPDLATLRSAYLSAQTAIREKEEQISVAVQSEDYDTAGRCNANLCYVHLQHSFMLALQILCKLISMPCWIIANRSSAQFMLPDFPKKSFWEVAFPNPLLRQKAWKECHQKEQGRYLHQQKQAPIMISPLRTMNYLPRKVVSCSCPVIQALAANHKLATKDQPQMKHLLSQASAS
jgi:predicted  nucleic acid-binding Zn-ribbon protein